MRCAGEPVAAGTEGGRGYVHSAHVLTARLGPVCLCCEPPARLLQVGKGGGGLGAPTPAQRRRSAGDVLNGRSPRTRVRPPTWGAAARPQRQGPQERTHTGGQEERTAVFACERAYGASLCSNPRSSFAVVILCSRHTASHCTTAHTLRLAGAIAAPTSLIVIASSSTSCALAGCTVGSAFGFAFASAFGLASALGPRRVVLCCASGHARLSRPFLAREPRRPSAAG
jgi:hypothetical protein